MAEMNGFELLKKLQGKEEIKLIPIIVVNDEHDKEIRDEVFGLLAVDFVANNADYMQLLPRARQFIG